MAGRPVNKATWERIKRLMKERGIENAHQLALRCDNEPTTATMSRWENGLDEPSRPSLRRIAAVLDLPVWRLLVEDDDREKLLLDALADPDAREEMINAAKRVAALKAKLSGTIVEPPTKRDSGPSDEK